MNREQWSEKCGEYYADDESSIKTPGGDGSARKKTKAGNVGSNILRSGDYSSDHAMGCCDWVIVEQKSPKSTE